MYLMITSNKGNEFSFGLGLADFGSWLIVSCNWRVCWCFLLLGGAGLGGADFSGSNLFVVVGIVTRLNPELGSGGSGLARGDLVMLSDCDVTSFGKIVSDLPWPGLLHMWPFATLLSDKRSSLSNQFLHLIFLEEEILHAWDRSAFNMTWFTSNFWRSIFVKFKSDFIK